MDWQWLHGDRIAVRRSSSGGLNAAQLADIEFLMAMRPPWAEAGIDANGFITEAPEPPSILVGLLGGLGMMWTVRRRKLGLITPVLILSNKGGIYAASR